MIIHGYINGIYYAVTAGEPRPDAAATLGVASGSRHAILLLEAHNTGHVLDETGEILDVNQPRSVRHFLEAYTQVIRVDDET